MRSVSEPLGEGVYYVGTEIAPGRYRVAFPHPAGPGSCRWWRLSGFGGTPEEVLGSYELGLIFARSFIVDIAPTDAGFVSTHC